MAGGAAALHDGAGLALSVAALGGVRQGHVGQIQGAQNTSWNPQTQPSPEEARESSVRVCTGLVWLWRWNPLRPGQAGGGAIGASRGSGSTTCRSWRGARWGATTHRAGTPHSLLVHLPTHAGVPATKQELVCAGTRRGRSSRRVAATGLCAGSDVELTRWACGVWEARGAPARAGRC
jgi:hypothetical protein